MDSAHRTPHAARRTPHTALRNSHAAGRTPRCGERGGGGLGRAVARLAAHATARPKRMPRHGPSACHGTAQAHATARPKRMPRLGPSACHGTAQAHATARPKRMPRHGPSRHKAFRPSPLPLPALRPAQGRPAASVRLSRRPAHFHFDAQFHPCKRSQAERAPQRRRARWCADSGGARERSGIGTRG
jgi:hypothetical protein